MQIFHAVMFWLKFILNEEFLNSSERQKIFWRMMWEHKFALKIVGKECFFTVDSLDWRCKMLHKIFFFQSWKQNWTWKIKWTPQMKFSEVNVGRVETSVGEKLWYVRLLRHLCLILKLFAFIFNISQPSSKCWRDKRRAANLGESLFFWKLKSINSMI